MVVGIDDDDAMMMLVDRNASGKGEPEVPRSMLADARQERLLAQRPRLYSMIATISDEDAIMIVIDRDTIRVHVLAWLVAFLAGELGHEREAVIAREYLHSMIVVLNCEQETSMMVECQAGWPVEYAISIAVFLGTNRELDPSIVIKRIELHPPTLSP